MFSSRSIGASCYSISSAAGWIQPRPVTAQNSSMTALQNRPLTAANRNTSDAALILNAGSMDMSQEVVDEAYDLSSLQVVRPSTSSSAYGMPCGAKH